jgi:hypothetical protein
MEICVGISSPRRAVCVAVMATLMLGVLTVAGSASGSVLKARSNNHRHRCVKHHHHRCPKNAQHLKKSQSSVPAPSLPKEPAPTTHSNFPGSSTPPGSGGMQQPTTCPTPPPPPMSSTTGALVGYLILSGGPPPGTPDCGSGAGDLVVTNGQGQIVATQEVPAWQFFQFVLPPGIYTLSATLVGGLPCEPLTPTVSVEAEHQTETNLACAIP